MLKNPFEKELSSTVSGSAIEFSVEKPREGSGDLPPAFTVSVSARDVLNGLKWNDPLNGWLYVITIDPPGPKLSYLGFLFKPADFDRKALEDSRNCLGAAGQ